MDMMRKKPELLSPAGDMEKLKMAVAYGADAWLFSIDADCGIIGSDYDPMEVPISWK